MSQLPDVPTLQPMLDKLCLWIPLDAGDRAAVLALPHTLHSLKAGHTIVYEDDRPDHCCLLLSGYAYRHKMTGSGARQIFSIHMRGDIADLPNSLLRTADHDVQALSNVEAAFLPVDALLELAFARPMVGKTLWYETLVDGAIFREWTLNVGRRDALTRTAHLLCEIALRLEAAGLGGKGSYELPMTQDQLADALSMTEVHVNRMLKELARTGLIVRAHRHVSIPDWRRLMRAGDFDGSYLHFADRAKRVEA